VDAFVYLLPITGTFSLLEAGVLASGSASLTASGPGTGEFVRAGVEIQVLHGLCWYQWGEAEADAGTLGVPGQEFSTVKCY
jgi:hypothetical protein